MTTTDELIKERDIYYFPNAGVASYKDKPIDYIDPAPKPFTVQIPLVEYFERIKRHKADKWQKDFCARLQSTAESRDSGKTWSLVHAEAQLGKSSLLAQTYAAWLLGHDPLIRFALATYNVTRSQTHSRVVIGIMNLSVHKDIFPNKEGHVLPATSKEKWQTPARRELNDGQDSFNPVGLQSGLTGSGFDWLIIDDPYADQKEAFSETVRHNLQDFWDFTVMSRISTFSNVFGMFHRYHVQDLAGYLLDTGLFDYWRYATICDGDYVHEETGKKYPDPLSRQIGEYISERRPPSYYDLNRKNTRVWSSMFQGKPTSDEGDFFNVGKLKYESRIDKQEYSLVRAWDNASTEEGGAYTVGVLMGISGENIVVFDVIREQLNTAQRYQKQLLTAQQDGFDVPVRIPQDPGSAGKDTVFQTEQVLKEFTVIPKTESGSKEMRAVNFSAAVNSGDVTLITSDWNKPYKTELRDFPLSDYKDCVDASANAYNFLYETQTKGLVVKYFRPQKHLLGWNEFRERFGVKIPATWTVYAGMKITPEANLPNSGIIVVRAPEHTGLEESLFILGEYKEYTADFYRLFEWMDAALKENLVSPMKTTILLHKNSASFRPTIQQKLKYGIKIFKEDEFAGLTELDWYLKSDDKIKGVVSNTQMSVATDANGLYGLRQEATTWGYNDKGLPTGVGAVLDCLRMVCHHFRTRRAPMTFEEKIQASIPQDIKDSWKDPKADTLTRQLNYEFQKDIAVETLTRPEDRYEDFA